MASRRVMLTFSHETSSEPIIYNIGQQFNVVTNIHQANASEDRGWIVVELISDERNIDAAIAWAISKGVRVEVVPD